MKINKSLSILITIIVTFHLLVPYTFANSEPYQNLPSSGTSILSNDEFLGTTCVNYNGWSDSVVSTDKGNALQIVTKSKTDLNMDYSIGYNLDGGFNAGDVGVISFLGKATAMTNGKANLGIVFQSRTTYEKYVYKECQMTDSWQQFNIPIGTNKDITQTDSQIQLWFGYDQQTIQITGFSIVNYAKNVTYESLAGYAFGTYKGREDGAAWRTEALNRIEQIRKGNINVVVKGSNGGVINNAAVDVNMTRNAFNFGSAITNLCWSGGSSYTAAELQNYRGNFIKCFNCGVIESSMKWNMFSAEDVNNSLAFMKNNGIAARGHCMYWDNSTWFNCASGSTVAEKKTSIINHVQNFATSYPDIIQWDVLNESTMNRTLRTDSNYGYSFLAQLYKTATANTNAKLYLNETNILGFDSLQYTKVKDIITNLKNQGAVVDGLGIQAHCGGTPAPPEDLYNQINDLSNYVNEIAITEYDFNTQDQQLAADHLRDMLIMAYSNPKINSFLIWGFWDKQHWQNNAPLFDANWNPKKAYYVWENLVLNQWKTKANGTTNGSGVYSTNGYLGTYKIDVTYGGETYTKTVNMDSTSGCTVEFDISASGTLTKDEILSSGTSIVTNSQLISAVSGSSSSAPKYFSDGNNAYYYSNYCGKCEGMEFHLNKYNGYTKASDAKVSITTTGDIKTGDICLLTFNAQKYWAPDNALMQFAINNGTNSLNSEVVYVDSNFKGDPTWAFTKQFVVPFVADQDYPTGSTLDICVGFTNYESAFIGGLELRNIGTVYTMDDIKNTFGLLPGLSNIQAVATSTDSNTGITTVTFSFSAIAHDTENHNYIVALYDADKLAAVKLINNVVTGTLPRTVNAVFAYEKGITPVTYTNIKVMAIDDFKNLKPFLKCAQYTQQ